MSKVVQWNVDGLGGKSDELADLIATTKPTVVAVNKMKSLTVRSLREAWPGMTVEEVPAVPKEWRAAPRAGIALTIQPGVNYAVYKVYSEKETSRNGLLQAINIELPKRIRLTGAYISTNNSAQAITNFLTDVITDGSGRDCLIGDLNARDAMWDTNSDARGRCVRKLINDTQQVVIAPHGPSFQARGRRASSTLDIAISNMRRGDVYPKRWEVIGIVRPRHGHVNL